MIGKTLSHYEILAKLGQGGMGEVYRARDTHLGREIALKVLPEQMALDPQRRARFQREARAVAALNHRNIVTIYSVESDGDQLFLTMELVPGRDLAAQIPDGGLPFERSLRIAGQVADALVAARAQGVIHRDLKPANVMVGPQDEVKLLDFGLAKLREDVETEHTQAGTQAVTQDGMIFGTVAYMSPEQLEGHPADHRSDLFSLGVIVYEMLTGKRPFVGATSAAIMSSILRDEPTRASTYRRDLPADLDRIIARSLEKDRSRRYQTAEELRSDLLGSIPANAPARETAPTEAPLQIATEPEEKTVAVLPFADLSRGGDQEYFCDGMTEEIINALTSVEGLKVASRTSSFRYRSREKDIRDIGKELGVELVLEGSVRTAGDRLRVMAQLVNVADGYQLWSERFDRTMDDVFEIQDEIAEAIARALETTVRQSGIHSAAKRHSDNLEAYHFYLRGRHWWNRREPGVLHKAIEFFRKAIDEDPEYALAYSGLADCYNVLGFYGFEEPNSAYARCRAAVERALAANPMQAEAYSSRAYARHHNDWNLEAAEEDYRRAIELKPDYPVAHQWRSVTLLCLERGDEALASVLRARELDPLSQVINTAVGWVNYMLGNADDALRELRRALELGSDFAWLHHMLGLAHLATDEVDRAEECFRRAVRLTEGASFYLSGLGLGLGRAGKTEEASEILRKLVERSEQEYVAANHVAAVCAGLGDDTGMFAWLDRAVEERASTLVYAPFEPHFALAHGDPRFEALLEKMRTRRKS